MVTPVDLSSIGRSVTSPPVSWTSDEGLLYAVGLGATAGPATWDELAYVTENSHGISQAALPTYAVIVAARTQAAGGALNLGSFPDEVVLHGEQAFHLHAPLPVEGTVVGTTTVEEIHDKGAHAAIVCRTDVADATTGAPVVTTRSTIIVRGAGGFDDSRRQGTSWSAPEGRPDDVVELDIRADQHLLYRLSGDRNPIHSDPWAARSAGFERPILHGMCTYGFVGRALLNSPAGAGGDAARFGGMSARFSTPVLPGETLTTHIWSTDAGAVFRVFVGDRVVLDHGTMTRAGVA